MFRSVPFWSSKKNLRLKCMVCRTLLPAEHFPHRRGPAHSLTCLGCKQLCVGCGVRQTADSFPDASKDMCGRCLAKQHVAATNVYFRYPTLQYRACPHSVDEMREEIKNELRRK